MNHITKILRWNVTPLVLLSAGLLALSSCPRKPSDATENKADATENKALIEPEAVVAEISATIIYDKLWFRKELGGRGTQELDVGEIVTIVGENEPDPENTDRNYTPIRLSDGTEGWVNRWFVIPESIPAVITQNAKIYSAPKLSKLTKRRELEAMHIVAIGAEGENDGFIRVSYTTPDGYAKHNDYIKAELVSEDGDDILAAHLYKLAMTAETEDMKVEFLESASQLQSSTFGMVIDNTLAQEKGLDDLITTLLVVKDGATSHEAPDEISPVVTVYSSNDILKTTNRSETKDIVDGIEDWWYFLESGDWIFGGFVKAAGDDL